MASNIIKFELETTLNGLLENPQSIDRIVVYHIQVKPGGQSANSSLNKTCYDPVLQTRFKKLQQQVGITPTKETIDHLQALKQKLEASSVTDTLRFNEANAVMVLGNRDMPAWKAGSESVVKPLTKGKFHFEWDAKDSRDGTYVLFWAWRVGDESSYAHQIFHISGDMQRLPIGLVNDTSYNKYKMLMDLYTPSMYKSKITEKDLTPEVIGNLNDGVAEGFALLEDLANQLGGMLDANSAHTAVLPLLANFFSLKLRGDDTNRWRGQIKRAVQLHKRKGTLNGLYEALDQTGIRLVKLTKLWQITSTYTQTDNFLITEENKLPGKLSKVPLTIEKIKLRASDGEWLNIPPDCIKIIPPVEASDLHAVLWQGNERKDQPLHVYPQDMLIITYNIKEIPEDRKAIENYIHSLPLSDDRPDSTKMKNWNVRLIEDDDPLFDVIIPNRFPFVPSVVFGKIRTKFLYSEQVYNMDTYNGSLRNSFIPNDLDHTFADQCSACQSSQFNVDLEIENLSDERIAEAKEIIKEYSPFHARLHSINVASTINEFILSPQEDIQCLVKSSGPKTLTKISQSEAIDYEIEWRDGTKEKKSGVI